MHSFWLFFRVDTTKKTRKRSKEPFSTAVIFLTACAVILFLFLVNFRTKFLIKPIVDRRDTFSASPTIAEAKVVVALYVALIFDFGRCDASFF